MVIDVGISKYYGMTASYLLFFAFFAFYLRRSTDLVRWKYGKPDGLVFIYGFCWRTNLIVRLLFLFLGGHLAALEIVENDDGSQSVYALYPGGKRLV